MKRSTNIFIGRLLLELIIVITGVFIAFQLNGIKEKRIEYERKKTFFEAFRLEMEYLDRESAFQREKLSKVIVGLKDKGRQAGIMRDGFSWLMLPTDMLILKAAFEETYTTLVGSKFLLALDSGYSLILMIQSESDRFRDNYDRLLKSGKTNPREMFDSAGNLKDEFKWILEDLASLKLMHEQLLGAIRQGAVPETEEIIQRLN